MERPKIAISMNLDWPLKRYHKLFQGIQEYAREFTDWLLVWDHFPEKALQRCKTKPYYAGVIGRVKYKSYTEIKRLNIPVINTWSTNSLKDLTSVYVDYAAAGEMAAEHLLKKGFRNFVNFDYAASASSTSFLKGFTRAVKPYNCPIQRYLISHRCDTSADLWDKLNIDFKRWIKEWKLPIGIFCSLSSIGPKITTRCIESGLRIPEDVAVVSSGNDLSYCEGFYPSITSVDISYYTVGYEAAKRLHMKMKGEEIDQKVTLIKPTSLVARESTDSYAVKDNELQSALRYICDNSQNNIQVIDVVDATGVSRSTLERKFADIIGHSIFNEINRMRISSAKRLLLETGMEVKQISKYAGFSSSHHFIRVFKTSTGTSPGKFREINRK